MYFVAAMLVCVACLVLYSTVLPRLPAMRYGRNLPTKPSILRESSEEDQQQLVENRKADRTPLAGMPLSQAILGYRRGSEMAELTQQVRAPYGLSCRLIERVAKPLTQQSLEAVLDL